MLLTFTKKHDVSLIVIIIVIHCHLTCLYYY
jgi:hypothetical protein